MVFDICSRRFSLFLNVGLSFVWKRESLPDASPGRLFLAT